MRPFCLSYLTGIGKQQDNPKTNQLVKKIKRSKITYYENILIKIQIQ